MTMIRTARALAKKGLAVFPLVPGSKVPATARGLRDATTDADTIAKWWRVRPDCNIGVATGTASGIFVVDVDNLEAEAALVALENAHGEKLPPTVEVITGKGRHLYFRMPEAPIRNSASKIAPGVDVRGTGGYVLAPPSIHPSGKKYAWSVDSTGEFAPAPKWLLDLIAAPASVTNGITATPPSEWRALFCDGIAEGARNNSATRIAGYLLRRNIDAVVALELLQLWNAARCAPPLPADEIERIAESIAGRELARRGVSHG